MCRFYLILAWLLKKHFGFGTNNGVKRVYNSAKVIIKSHFNFEIIRISQKFAKNSDLDRLTVSKIYLTSKSIWPHCKVIQKLLSIYEKLLQQKGFRLKID